MRTSVRRTAASSQTASGTTRTASNSHCTTSTSMTTFTPTIAWCSRRDGRSTRQRGPGKQPWRASPFGRHEKREADNGLDRPSGRHEKREADNGHDSVKNQVMSVELIGNANSMVQVTKMMTSWEWDVSPQNKASEKMVAAGNRVHLDSRPKGDVIPMWKARNVFVVDLWVRKDATSRRPDFHRYLQYRKMPTEILCEIYVKTMARRRTMRMKAPASQVKLERRVHQQAGHKERHQ